MSATSIERNTDSLLSSGVPPFRQFPVAGGEKILYGTIVLVAPQGIIEGQTTVGAIGAGVARATVDNLTGSNGDKRCDVGFGVYYFANSSGGDAISEANFGSLCYVVDNQTVAKTDGSGTRSKAGTVFDINVYGQVGVHFSDIVNAL